MKNLVQKRKTDYTFKSMEDLCISIQQLLGGLETCQGLSATQLIAYFKEDSFTEQLKHEWEVFSVDIIDPPTTEEILEFLKKRMANLSISMKSSSASHPFAVSHPKPVSSAKPKGHVFKIEEKKNFSCALCKGEFQCFGRCPTFKSWSQQKRYNHIKSVSACINCLHPGHSSRDCQSRYKGRECNLNHHTLLHHDQTSHLPDSRPSLSAGNNPPSTSTNTVARIQGPQEGAILATALVSVSSEKYVKSTRILLDPGSTISIMTTSLAIELQSELTPLMMHIEGIAGVTTSNYVATVILSSAFQETETSSTSNAKWWQSYPRHHQIMTYRNSTSCPASSGTVSRPSIWQDHQNRNSTSSRSLQHSFLH